jgi:hypothetical protein
MQNPSINLTLTDGTKIAVDIFSIETVHVTGTYVLCADAPGLRPTLRGNGIVVSVATDNRGVFTPYVVKESVEQIDSLVAAAQGWIRGL